MVWRRLLKHVFYRGAEALGIQALLRWARRRGVPVLCYHSIVNRPLPGSVRHGGLHLDADQFRDQMLFVRRHYRVVSLRELVATAVAGRDAFPPGRLAITFDDGYANVVNVALPVLRDFGFPATVFLATDYIDRDELFWWDELSLLCQMARWRTLRPEAWGQLDLRTPDGVRQVVARGRTMLEAATMSARRTLLDSLADALGLGSRPWADYWETLRPCKWSECRAAVDDLEFGGHSAAHRCLDLLSRAEIRDEILGCEKALRKELSVSGALAFAYPAGRYSVDTIGMLGESSFVGAAVVSTSARGQRLYHAHDDRWRIPRIGVNPSMSRAVFSGDLCGVRVPPWLDGRNEPRGT